MEFKISKNTVVDFGFSETVGEWCDYFDFHMGWNRKCDHAGFRTHFTIMQFSPYFEIRDTRHWDDEKNAWCKDNDWELNDE
jgi:hypothetical protein